MQNKILGIDYGRKRVGLALSDVNRIIALPFKTLQISQKPDEILPTLKDIISSENVSDIVLGLPLLMNGKDSEMTKEVREFAKKLEVTLGVDIHLWDERLSSSQVERLLIEGSMKRKKRTQVVDTLSSTVVLQSFLDSKQLCPV